MVVIDGKKKGDRMTEVVLWETQVKFLRKVNMTALGTSY